MKKKKLMIAVMGILIIVVAIAVTRDNGIVFARDNNRSKN